MAKKKAVKHARRISSAPRGDEPDDETPSGPLDDTDMFESPSGSRDAETDEPEEAIAAPFPPENVPQWPLYLTMETQDTEQFPPTNPDEPEAVPMEAEAEAEELDAEGNPKARNPSWWPVTVEGQKVIGEIAANPPPTTRPDEPPTQAIPFGGAWLVQGDEGVRHVLR